MPTIITIDGVTLVLKKYPEFVAGTPIATDITLFSDPVNGDLFKTTMDNLIANILNVDGVTITGDGSSGNPLVATSGTLADNGTHIDTGKVYLGGTLLENTTINGNGNYLTVNGNDSIAALQASNSSTGYAIQAQGNDGNGLFAFSSTQAAIVCQSLSNYGIAAVSISSQAAQFLIQPASTNTIDAMMRLDRRTSGTPANGIGTSIDYYVETSLTATELSNQLISKWIDQVSATRTSQFVITGVNSASAVDLIKLNADGSWQIRPITATAAGAITPAEGMMLFVSSTDATFTSIGFWGYRNGAWAAF